MKYTIIVSMGSGVNKVALYDKNFSSIKDALAWLKENLVNWTCVANEAVNQGEIWEVQPV